MCTSYPPPFKHDQDAFSDATLVHLTRPGSRTPCALPGPAAPASASDPSALWPHPNFARARPCARHSQEHTCRRRTRCSQISRLASCASIQRGPWCVGAGSRQCRPDCSGTSSAVALSAGAEAVRHSELSSRSKHRGGRDAEIGPAKDCSRAWKNSITRWKVGSQSIYCQLRVARKGSRRRESGRGDACAGLPGVGTAAGCGRARGPREED